MAEIWKRLESDTPKSFDAFESYRDMGVSRSTAKVGQALGKSKGLIDRWCRKHGWVERVAAYDSWLDSQATDAFADELTSLRVESAKRIVEDTDTMMTVMLMPFAALMARYNQDPESFTRSLTGKPSTDLLELAALMGRTYPNIAKVLQLVLGAPTESIDTRREDDDAKFLAILSDPDAVKLALAEFQRQVVGEDDASGSSESGD